MSCLYGNVSSSDEDGFFAHVLFHVCKIPFQVLCCLLFATFSFQLGIFFPSPIVSPGPLELLFNHECKTTTKMCS